MHKNMLFVVSGMLLIMNIVGMQQENKFIVVPNDILYKITHDCSLQSIGRLKRTCKELSKDHIDSRYYTGRLICGLDKNSSVVMSQLKYFYSYYKYEQILRYFANQNDNAMFDFCQTLPNYHFSGLGGLFMDAVRKQDINYMYFLVMQKGVYNLPEEQRDYCLYLACEYKKTDLVEKMIRAGADVNYTSHYTPLHFACMNKDVELAKYLIQNGADINIVGAKGGSSLDIMEKMPEFKELVDSLSFFDVNYAVIRGAALPLMFGVGGVVSLFCAKIFGR